MPAESSKAFSRPPVVLTIAGSDSSAGAGLQADLKTFAAHGVYGICTATSVVAEIPGHVTGFDPVDPSLVMEQLAVLAEGFSIAAIKTGMLATPQIVAAVADFVERHSEIPLVVDPVMVATSGDRLLAESAVALYRNRLLPLATIATPNFAEAEALLAHPVGSVDDMREAAEAFVERFHCGAVVVKGGHLPETDDAVDVFFSKTDKLAEFRAPRVPGIDTHGTGCTFSAAIAAQLARGLDLPRSVASGKRYISAAIEQSHQWPCGDGEITALNHFPTGVTSFTE